MSTALSDRAHLLFAYNADSGLFNALSDAAHKALSPSTYSCNLCRVTYGLFSERAQWRTFIASLDADCRFLHRDELHARFPDLEVDLPCVLRLHETAPTPCIDAAALNACRDIADLAALVRRNCLTQS